MSYFYLVIAIIAEVIGTSMLKESNGFSRLIPGVISLTLKTMPTGIVYAIWSGFGIVLIAIVAWVFQGQKLDVPAMAGMALIIVGICVMNLFSKAGV